jgi:hypothetical protein
MSIFFFHPAAFNSMIAGPEVAKEPSGETSFRLIQIRLTTSSFEEISLGCQEHFT